MGRQATHSMAVDAEFNVPIAKAQLVHFQMNGPADNILRRDDSYWLDLCLTPRPGNARACFRERWSPHRFERIGRVFLVPPGEPLQARSDGSIRQSSMLCHLKPEPMQQWFDGELQWTHRRLEASLDITNQNVRTLLLRMAEELRNPGFATASLLELMAAQLAIELSRYCASITEPSPVGTLAPWRLRLIDERLKEVREAPTLSELAGLCKLSVRQLTRGFRASRGLSLGEYIAQCRIEHAKQLLSSDHCVKTVAYTLGFAAPSSFCFAFHRATGETPNQYRQRTRRGL